MAITRETFEWNNIWWDHADDLSLPRVLLIGDSISVGYGAVVTERLAGVAHVDRLSTSRGVTDPAYLQEVRYMLGLYRYAVIHVNNGLHGWHLDDATEYAGGVRALLAVLREHGAPIIWASSTPVSVRDDVHTLDPERNPRVLQRNAAAAAIMAEEGILVNDLYAAIVDSPDVRSPDGYHYLPEGYAVMGARVGDEVRRLLP